MCIKNVSRGISGEEIDAEEGPIGKMGCRYHQLQVSKNDNEKRMRMMKTMKY